MKLYRFDYPKEFVTLPDYSAHRGQLVQVIRPLRHKGNHREFDFQGEAMFLVRASDGWEGHAFKSELVTHHKSLITPL